MTKDELNQIYKVSRYVTISSPIIKMSHMSRFIIYNFRKGRMENDKNSKMLGM